MKNTKKNVLRIVLLLSLVLIAVSMAAFPALAADEKTAAETTSAAANLLESDIAVKAIAAAAIIIVGSGVGAVAMAIAVKHSVEGTARQPEAAGAIRTSMMMGLVFIETAIIYALIVAILIIFTL